MQAGTIQSKTAPNTIDGGLATSDETKPITSGREAGEMEKTSAASFDRFPYAQENSEGRDQGRDLREISWDTQNYNGGSGALEYRNSNDGYEDADGVQSKDVLANQGPLEYADDGKEIAGNNAAMASVENNDDNCIQTYQPSVEEQHHRTTAKKPLQHEYDQKHKSTDKIPHEEIERKSGESLRKQPPSRDDQNRSTMQLVQNRQGQQRQQENFEQTSIPQQRQQQPLPRQMSRQQHQFDSQQPPAIKQHRKQQTSYYPEQNRQNVPHLLPQHQSQQQRHSPLQQINAMPLHKPSGCDNSRNGIGHRDGRAPDSSSSSSSASASGNPRRRPRSPSSTHLLSSTVATSSAVMETDKNDKQAPNLEKCVDDVSPENRISSCSSPAATSTSTAPPCTGGAVSYEMHSLTPEMEQQQQQQQPPMVTPVHAPLVRTSSEALLQHQSGLSNGPGKRSRPERDFVRESRGLVSELKWHRDQLLDLDRASLEAMVCVATYHASALQRLTAMKTVMGEIQALEELQSRLKLFVETDHEQVILLAINNGNPEECKMQAEVQKFEATKVIGATSDKVNDCVVSNIISDCENENSLQKEINQQVEDDIQQVHNRNGVLEHQDDDGVMDDHGSDGDVPEQNLNLCPLSPAVPASLSVSSPLSPSPSPLSVASSSPSPLSVPLPSPTSSSQSFVTQDVLSSPESSIEKIFPNELGHEADSEFSPMGSNESPNESTVGDDESNVRHKNMSHVMECDVAVAGDADNTQGFPLDITFRETQQLSPIAEQEEFVEGEEQFAEESSDDSGKSDATATSCHTVPPPRTSTEGSFSQNGEFDVRTSFNSVSASTSSDIVSTTQVVQALQYSDDDSDGITYEVKKMGIDETSEHTLDSIHNVAACDDHQESQPSLEFEALKHCADDDESTSKNLSPCTLHSSTQHAAGELSPMTQTQSLLSPMTQTQSPLYE